MYTILGSGFGLYGYLPALLRELDEKVVLPRAYSAKLAARPELADCLARVVWKADRDECLLAASKVIVCLPPTVQAGLCETLAGLSNVDTVVLEKPVAGNPADAAKAFEKLLQNRKSVIVNYSFLYLDWYERLKRLVSATPQTGSVSAVWQFRAHHYQHDLLNWKAMPDQGGGVLRFYGIHLIALLAGLGYTGVAHSRIERSGSRSAARWRAGFSRPGSAPFEVTVDSNAEAMLFSLRGSAAGTPEAVLDAADPFTDSSVVSRSPADDRRIPILARVLRGASTRDEATKALYRRVNALWSAVEDRTETTP